ncbi:MAG: hypothetical protein H0X33_14345 [Taibaiella sp.]|nr:hypothetical protein [Taibaiella sp.]
MEDQNHQRFHLVIDIAGTNFYVDNKLQEFREVGALSNRISMEQIGLTQDGIATIAYDLNTKNIYEDIIVPGNIPENVKLVIIPPGIHTDPLVLAHRYGLLEDGFARKRPEQKNNEVQAKNINKRKRGYRL